MAVAVTVIEPETLEPSVGEVIVVVGGVVSAAKATDEDIRRGIVTAYVSNLKAFALSEEVPENGIFILLCVK